MLQDAFLSKFMATHPTRFYYGTRGKTGVGADLFDLRSTIDGLALKQEIAGDVLWGLYSDNDDIAVAGVTGYKLSNFNGIPSGYEKAARRWSAYVPAENLTITAVIPGELGNKISIKFARAAADAVSVVGTVVLLTIDNDGLTQPSHLQTLIDANPKLKGLIQITSTADTAFPDAWVIARAAEAAVYLAGGTGRGWGYELVGVWGSTTSICFVAKQPGSGYDYEIAWVAGAALNVSADRRRCTITYVNVTTTYAQVMAAVLANPIAMEHLFAIFVPGGGAGTVTGLNGQVAKLTSDFMTSLFVGPQKAIITDIGAQDITYDASAIAVAAGGVLNARMRLCGLFLGDVSLITV